MGATSDWPLADRMLSGISFQGPTRLSSFTGLKQRSLIFQAYFLYIYHHRSFIGLSEKTLRPFETNNCT